jgi:zinc and cadmium transporter
VPAHEHRDAASASLILFGDGFHNVLDGVLIAAAFLTDTHLGVVTAIAVFAHEIPQEVGDLAILLNGGLSRRKALVLNLLASLTSVVGGVIAYFALEPALHLLPYALAIAASSFLYVAVADLIPGLHRQIDMGSGVAQFTLIALGVIVIYTSHATLH